MSRTKGFNKVVEAPGTLSLGRPHEFIPPASKFLSPVCKFCGVVRRLNLMGKTCKKRPD